MEHTHIKILCLGLAFMLYLAGCQPIQAESALPQAPATTTSTGTATLAAPNTGSNTGTVTIYGGDEETLREFLRHSLSSPYTSNEESATSVYIGSLPPDLPFTLELSGEITGETSTVGSIVTTGEFASSQLMFQQEQNVTEAVAALRQQLQDQGYTQIDRSGGEIFQSQSDEYVPFCNAEGTLAVMVSGRNLPDGTGIIHVHVNNVSTFGGPCTPQPSGGGAGEFEEIMPSLPAPANISTFSSGMSSGGDRVEATIEFRGDTTIAALAEHYTAELEAAGWQQTAASQTEDMAWSGWSVTEPATEPVNEETQAYSATFYILRDAGSSDSFRASLRIGSDRGE